MIFILPFNPFRYFVKVKNLRKFICKECIERRLGYLEGLSPKDRLQKAKELMKKHKSCINYGKVLLTAYL